MKNSICKICGIPRNKKFAEFELDPRDNCSGCGPKASELTDHDIIAEIENDLETGDYYGD